jgi:hypothetical protein
MLNPLEDQVMTQPNQSARFSDLAVGQTFDFIGPDPMLNSFYALCTKRSARTYTWDGGRYGTLKASVGSKHVTVYHVDEEAR